MAHRIRERNFFLCIGAQKAGTTWLYANLRKHSEIYMPPFKELHFFDFIGNTISYFGRFSSSRRIDAKWRLRLTILFRRIRRLEKLGANIRLLRLITLRRIKRNIPRYFSLLYKPGYTICGEITLAYAILDEQIVGSIHQSAPSLKVVFILREPIERYWSMLCMVLNKHLQRPIAELSPEELFLWINKENKRNDYAYTLRNWLKYYPPEQVLILFYEDLQKDQLQFLNRICAFLGVTPFAAVPAEAVKNPGIKSEMPVVVEKRLLEKFIPVLEELTSSSKHLFHSEYPDLWLQKAKARRNELSRQV